jgi:hypothetical protein
MDLLRLFEQPTSQDDIGHLLGGNQQPQQDQSQDAQTGIGNLLGGSDQEQTGENPGEESPEQEDKQLDSMIDQAATQDPDKQGLIRAVDRAHLVYKRQTEDGTYEELWIYNVGKLQDELDIRKAILAGTDIPTNKRTSPDGLQTYDIWSAGNAELLHIEGLPN